MATKKYERLIPLNNLTYDLNMRAPLPELVLEEHTETFTIAVNTADLEVATELDEVLGVIPAGYMSVFAAGDYINSLVTDGVITTGAVTVRILTTSVGDGAFTTRFFLLGRFYPKAQS